MIDFILPSFILDILALIRSPKMFIRGQIANPAAIETTESFSI